MSVSSSCKEVELLVISSSELTIASYCVPPDSSCGKGALAATNAAKSDSTPNETESSFMLVDFPVTELESSVVYYNMKKGCRCKNGSYSVRQSIFGSETLGSRQGCFTLKTPYLAFHATMTTSKSLLTHNKRLLMAFILHFVSLMHPSNSCVSVLKDPRSVIQNHRVGR